MRHRPITRDERREEYPHEWDDILRDLLAELKRLDARELQRVLWNIRKRGGR